MISVHLENGVVTTRAVPAPSRPAGHALLKLLVGGICNTDLELQRGYYGFAGTPGHEFVAEVVEAESPALIGARVVGDINLACGECDWCRKEMGRHCPNRTVLGIVNCPGCFSEFFTLPERNLHVVPDGVSNDRAVFTEPLAAACEILEQVQIPPGEPVAVLGDGKLGLLVALALDACGHKVHLFGRHREKLDIADAAGVETEITPQQLPRASYGWVVEATGNAEGLASAVTLVRPRGTIILKSTVHGAVALDMAPVVVNEVTLLGSRCGRFEPALEMLSHGLIQVEKMICARFPLAEAPQAFRTAAQKGAMKVLLG